ncbi:hypothetical protein WM22_20535 [Burkholderia ubonensis]|uniref:hypothetical protein n=1 Tax=Burkholderia ubonensis TaxID=101571 RepID=UPI0007542C9B|nr:hypothetical protein [Burkholderia ubonensis]KWK91028.1 hypothetical protein WM20_26545 [Burkholderia ubonensis]KWK92650.1 hypothetical protein WM19_21415 [Burkholderia ubonensis]KWN34201.1 hypothetical protein WM22_20535 [Burkholderia ubonensis]ODQ24793.1 hypothetical protein BGV64_24695 [Burkholderia ubonensis]
MENDNSAHEEAAHVLAMVELVNNGNERIDWDYWAGKMPRWTAHQAVRLMAALDPTKHNDLSFRRNETAGAAKEQAKRLETLAASCGMTDATPHEWLDWADRMREAVHGGLRAALQKPTSYIANGYEDRYRAVVEHANGAMLTVAELDAWATSNKVPVSFETLLKDEIIAEDYSAERHFIHYSLLSIVLASRLVPEGTEPGDATVQLMAAGDTNDYADPVRRLRDLIMVRYDRQLLNAVFDGSLNLYDSLTMSPIDLSAARQRYKANPDTYAQAAQARIMDATGGTATSSVLEEAREILRQKFARLDHLAWAMVVLATDAPAPGEARYRQILSMTQWLQSLQLPFRHENGLPAVAPKGVVVSGMDVREFQYLAVTDVRAAAIDAHCWPLNEERGNLPTPPLAALAPRPAVDPAPSEAKQKKSMTHDKPKWSVWNYMHKVSLRDAVCLSYDVAPGAATLNPVENGIAHLLGLDFVGWDMSRKISERLSIARSHAGTGGTLPTVTGDKNGDVYLAAFAEWAVNTMEWDVPDEFRALAESTYAATARATAMPPQLETTKAAARRPLKQQAHQEAEILRVIRELNHDPKKLPKQKPGKPGVKAAVREKLNFSKKVFDKAWDRLRASGDVADNEHSPKLG